MTYRPDGKVHPARWWWEIATGTVASPRALVAELRDGFAWVDALGYLAVNAFLAALVAQCGMVLALTHDRIATPYQCFPWSVTVAAIGALVAIVVTPVRAVLYHAMAKAFGGRCGFATTLRALALSSVGLIAVALAAAWLVVGSAPPGPLQVVVLLASAAPACIVAEAFGDWHGMPRSRASLAAALGWAVESAIVCALMLWARSCQEP